MTTDLHYHGPVVALDLDDTLYPEADYVLSAYQAVAAAIARRDNIPEGQSLKVMQRAFRIGHNPFDALLDAFPSISRKELFVPLCVEIYRYHTPSLTLPEESRLFLDNLREKGVRMALITDGRAVTQWAKFHALGLREFFSDSDVWVSEERGIGKLSINPWRTLVDRYPEAKAFIAVGDNPAKDFLYPNMLGFSTFCLRDRGSNVHSQDVIPSPAHEPGHKVKSLAEVAQFIFKL